MTTIVPHDVVWENAEATCAALEQPVAAGADLVVLAEMFATGCSTASERIAEPPGGLIERWLRRRSSRVGDGDGPHYAGNSAVMELTGTIQVGAVEQETVLYADVHAAPVRSTREHLGFLGDRRTGAPPRTTGADLEPAEPDNRG